MQRIGLLASTIVEYSIPRALGARILLVLLLCSGAADAATYNAAGTIAALRIYPLLQSTSSGQDVSMFQLSPGSGLGNGCQWLWIAATDKNTLAVLLMTKQSGATVTIVYDNTVISPWGDSTVCALVQMDQS